MTTFQKIDSLTLGECTDLAHLISPQVLSFVASNLPANQISIQAGAKPDTNQARVITLTNTVEYCTPIASEITIRKQNVMISTLISDIPSQSQQNPDKTSSKRKIIGSAYGG